MFELKTVNHRLGGLVFWGFVLIRSLRLRPLPRDESSRHLALGLLGAEAPDPASRESS